MIVKDVSRFLVTQYSDNSVVESTYRDAVISGVLRRSDVPEEAVLAFEHWANECARPGAYYNICSDTVAGRLMIVMMTEDTQHDRGWA